MKTDDPTFDRIVNLERAIAEVSLKNEELEKLVRDLQKHQHILQRGLHILLSEKNAAESPPEEKPPAAAIQDL